MKRLFLPLFCIVMLLLPTQQVLAQWNWGGKAGFVFSLASFNYTLSDQEPLALPRTSLQVGLLTERYLGEQKRFFIRPELMLTGKGYSRDLKNTFSGDVKGYDRVTVTYLEFPLSLGYRSEGGFQISAGPYIALATGGTRKWDYEVDEVPYKGSGNYVPILSAKSEDYFASNEAGIYKFDYGLAFGLGYQVKATLFQLSYSRGFQNVTAPAEGVAVGDFKATQQCLTLSAVWLFNE